MKTALALLGTAILLGCIIGIALFRAMLYERKRCEGCAFYDHALQYCWSKSIRIGTKDKACIGHKAKEKK